MDEVILGERIVRVASRFVGLREVKANQDWDDPRTPGRETKLAEELRRMMRPAPWEPGWAYCAAACEGWVVTAMRELDFAEKEVQRFAKVMGPHCVSAANAFKALGLLEAKPAVGALWLARHGRTSNGHAGVTTAQMGPRIATVEANTSLDSSNPAKDREGDWITTRLFSYVGRGSLKTMGFVTPRGILELVG